MGGAIIDGEPSNGDDVWLVANWAFRWLMHQAAIACTDPSIRDVFELAPLFHGLSLRLHDPETAATMRRLLLDVAKRGAMGLLPLVEVEGRVLDNRYQVSFLTALVELVVFLSRRG